MALPPSASTAQRALLHGGQTGWTAAPEHAGVAEYGHDRQQRVEPGVLLTGTGGAATLQLWQAVADDGGEALLRLLAGAAGAVAAADLLAVAVLRDHGRVVQQGEAPGADGKGVGVRKGIEGRDRYQQAEGPDCAAMGVYPPVVASMAASPSRPS